MKKLLSAMSLILGLGLATAQQTAPASTTTTHRQVAKTAKAATADSKTAKPMTIATTGAKMKKDGTPDKRYKANKKLKKDGTLDKRYKENK